MSTAPTPTESEEQARGHRLALSALIYAFLGFCLFPFAIAGLIEGIRALSKGRTRSGSSAQVMAIVALCLSPVSVVSGIGTCAAVAIPVFVKYMRRSKTSEAFANVDVLYDAVVAAHAGTGRLPEPLGPTPATPGFNRQLWPADAAPGWAALGFHPSDPIYYSYEVWVSPDAGRFAVRAHGDLDGDGIQSLVEREGVVQGNAIRGQPHPFVEHETE